MIEILPFKGILYNEEKVGDLGRVVTPPYDVIDERWQREFYQMSEYNSIRLILGQEFPNDDEEENKYKRAARFFKQWRDEGVLLQDEDDSIYVYEEEFRDGRGVMRRRRGFIALLKLEEFGKGNIFPHEETMSKPKEDRLRLMRACGANFSQVFGLYSTPSASTSDEIDEVLSSLCQYKPRIALRDRDGVIHRIWSTSSRDDIARLGGLIKDARIYIADGHHRYETALTYRDEERRARGDFSGHAPFDYIMMMFVKIDDPGLLIFPFHRVLKGLDAERLKELGDILKPIFRVERLTSPPGRKREGCAWLLERMEEAGKGSHAFGAYVGESETFYLFTLEADDETIDELVEGEMSLARKRLDVTILHSVVFKKLLGMTEEGLKMEGIEYVRDEGKALEMVTSGGYQVAFFLNPTKVEDVRSIAENGEKMPQKSTYFYPKLLTGLVFRSMER